MAEVIKAYTQKVPAMRFIGKKYGDSDRVNGGFGEQWGQWFANGWFDVLEKAAGGSDGMKKIYEDGDAYLGMMRWKDGEPFQYWVGMFFPSGMEVPEGFESVDFDESVLGTCWLQGPDGTVYGQEDKCAAKLAEMGCEIISDSEGAFWFFERYGCPRFTTPDENGNIILDICHYIKG